jgi:hypothetical protein
MKTCDSIVTCLLFLLMIFGTGPSALLADTPKEDGSAKIRVTSEENIASDESIMVGDSIRLGCWKVKIHYEIQVKNTGSYKLGESGNVDGLLTFSEDGTYNLTFETNGQLQAMQQGTYTIDTKSVSLIPNTVMPWLEGEIDSLGSQKNWTVDIKDPGNYMDAPPKPSRISSAKINGETVPSNIGPVTYKLDSKGATIVIDGHEFNNAEIIFKLKITFERKKSIKCAKNGNITVSCNLEYVYPEAKGTLWRFQIIDFSMFPDSSTDAICKLSGEDPGATAFKQDAYSPNCEIHQVCDIIVGIVGKVGNEMTEQCENKLTVDFAETWNCYTASSCMPPRTDTYIGTYSIAIDYKDGAVVDYPVPNIGSCRVTLRLEY